MSTFSESIVEDAALEWLAGLGYSVLHGPDLAVGMPGAERNDPGYRDVILERRLRDALVRLNPALPPEALEDAYRQITRVDAPSLVERNREVYRMMVSGVEVEYVVSTPSPRPSPGGRGGSEAGLEGFGRMPVLSTRRNIVVLADEAHRSQYDFIDGFARHMRDALPNASFIGFTGMPIELTDKNTRAVFGDYISVYDIRRAVEDKATVPIYYESRLAKLELNEAERPKIDPDFEDVTEGEEEERKEKLKTRWAQIEPSWARRSGWAWSRETLSSTTRSGWRRWTARR